MLLPFFDINRFRGGNKKKKRIRGGGMLSLCALHDWLAACLSGDHPPESSPEPSGGQIIVNNRNQSMRRLVGGFPPFANSGLFNSL